MVAELMQEPDVEPLGTVLEVPNEFSGSGGNTCRGAYVESFLLIMVIRC